MIAQALLNHAAACGVRIALDGSDLVLEADCRPPPALLEDIKAHKPALIDLVRNAHIWTPAEWQAFFLERAATAERKAGLPRLDAERRAFACCVAEWLCRYPETSAPGACAWCNKPDGGGSSVVLPFGTESWGHVWLHSECWDLWQLRRQETARAALHAMGITGPDEAS